MTAHHIQPFVSGSFRLAQRFLVFCLFVFRFQHVVAHVSPYFYSYEISIIWIHLPIHQLINIRMGSTFWLANNLTNICVRALVWPRFQFPQEYALQWNWLGNVFQSGVQHFTSSSAVWGFQYLHILTKHLLSSAIKQVIFMLILYPAHLAKHGCRCAVLCCVWLSVVPWTVARQAPLPVEFSRQEYWSGLPFPSPGESGYPGQTCIS